MELPQLPTDNLYKFMALSGIAVIVISLAPLLHAHRLRVESIRLGGDIHVFEKEVSWTTEERKSLEIKMGSMEQDADRLMQRADALESDVPKASDRRTLGEPPEEMTTDLQATSDHRRELEDETLELKDRLEEYRELSKRFAELSKKDEISLVQLAAKVKEHNYIVKVTCCEAFVGMLGLIYGPILTRKGFKLWYRKLQVFQDKVIRMKAESTNGRSLDNGRDDQA